MTTPREWLDKTLAELNIRQDHHVNIVAIKRTREVTHTNGETTTIETIVDVPLPTSRLLADDILIIAGHEKDLEKLPTS